MGKKNKPKISDEGKEAFLKLAGADGEIDAFELQDILNTVFIKDFSFDGFSTDMARSMVALNDMDLSGTLCFKDFKKLWSDLAFCKRAFKILDTDGSGCFSREEFQSGLEKLGLEADETTLQAVMTRYSDKDGTVKFDDFVACYMKLKKMFKTFKAKDNDGEGEIEFCLDEYVQLCIYT